MTNKLKTFSLLLAGTFLTSPAFAADTVNSYDDLLNILQSTADADVILNMNGDGINLNGATGVSIASGQNVVFTDIGTKGVSSWTDTSYNINNAGTIAVKDSIFSGNTAEMVRNWANSGGIIQNKGYITEIINSVFDNNTADCPYDLWGGVLGNEGTIDLIKDVVFSNNFAKSSGNNAPHGGVIYNGKKIGTIDSVIFENNSMTSDPNNIGGAHGVAIDNNEGGSIDKITNSKFINNKTYRTGEEIKTGNYHASAGAVDNYNYIGEISDTLFQGNSAEVESASASAGSGAIMNLYGGTNMAGRIDAISNVQFIENHVIHKNGSAYAGAISNGSAADGGVGSIGVMDNVLFSGNYALGERDDSGYIGAYGGAIMNSGEVGAISGRFENNYARNVSGASAAWGGAINNRGTSAKIGSITADFTGNYAQADSGNSQGGAILNYGQSSIEIIKGSFSANRSLSSTGMSNGGAVYNQSGTIAGIEGDFTGNYVESGGRASGGAVNNNNSGEITNGIAGNFRKNYAKASGSGSMARGGAIINFGKMGTVSGDFTDNYADSAQSSAVGGAVYNAGTISEFLNSNFIGNYVKGNDGTAGGAIWSSAELNVTADEGTSLFSGNKANDKSNAIYMSGAEDAVVDLNLSALNKGTITFDDGIDGKNYNINVTGDGSGVVKFNNLVENVTNFTLSDSSVVHLGLNADIQTQNMSVATDSSLVGKNAVSSPIITVDVEVDKAANKVNSGAIHVDNDVSGDYRVLVNALNPDVLDNLEDAIVPFLFAPEDKEDTASSFSVARVIGSPYLWDGSINAKGEETGSVWYLNLTDKTNPDYTSPVAAPEVIAGAGLHEAAIEQTRSVVRNVRTKVADGRVYCPGCGLYDYAWNNQQLRNVWVLAQGETATIDKPVKMDADIWGVEAGFDIQNDVNNTLGVFASYRKGEYDLNGKTDKVRSNIGSEIDIDSYLAGLYYRYDKNMNWLFATVYGGVQQADAKTDDGIAKFDTDAVEFGAGIEAGHTFALSSDLTLDPSLGLYYTQVNFDDAKDNVGKEYDWKDIKHLEAELGAKLEKQIDYAKIYVKPSVIQTITSGDSVRITGLNKLSTYDDQTLGRIELGGRYGFTDALSAYGWVNYTFGSGYDATAFGAGLNYSW